MNRRVAIWTLLGAALLIAACWLLFRQPSAAPRRAMQPDPVATRLRSGSPSGDSPGGTDVGSAGEDAIAAKLEPPAELYSVRVVVRDPRGKLVDGARVTASLAPPTPDPTTVGSGDPEASAIEARAIGGGVYEIEGLPPGIHLFAAEAPGRPGMTEEVAVPRREPIELVLERGRRASGVVLDSGRRPLEGAEVSGRRTHRFGHDSTLVEVTTDGEGRFALEALDSGSGVYATLEGYTEISRDLEADAENLELVLFREGEITGQAVDAATGAPLAGVRVYSRDSIGFHEATADDSGRFTLDKLSQGKHQLGLDLDGYLPASHGPIQIDEGAQATGVIVRLEKGFTQRGRVVDVDTEEPIRRAWINASQQVGEGEQGVGVGAAVRDDGSFELRGLSAGTHVIQVEFARRLRRDFEVELPSDDLTLRFEPGAPLVGTAFDPDGMPLAGVEVTLTRPRPRRGDPTRSDDLRRLDSLRPHIWPQNWRVVTDRSGEFRFDDMPECDSCALLARSPGLTPARVTGIAVRRHEATQPVEIQMKRGGVIRGRVLDGRGQGVEGASVDLQRVSKLEMLEKEPGTRQETTRSREGGAYELRGLEPGEWSIHAEADGSGRTPDLALQIPGEETREADLQFRSGLQMTGEVTDTGGRPLEGAQVTLYDGKATTLATTNEAGRFVVSGLNAGPLVVMATKPGFMPLCRLLGGQTENPRLTLEQGATIVGRLVLPEQGVLPPARIQVLDLEGHEDGSCSSDDTGHFTCATGLREATLKVEVNGFAPRRLRFELTPGEKRRVTIPLVAPGTLVGRLVSAATGELVGNGAVRVENVRADDWETPSLWTDVDPQGEFVRDDLVEGAFRVAAHASGYRLAYSDEIEIKPDKTASVELKLEPAQGILGTVSRTGRGAPNVPVTARNLATGTEARAVTHRAGDFELLGLEPGGYELRAGPDPDDPRSNVELTKIDIEAEATIRVLLDLSAVHCDGQVVGRHDLAQELIISIFQVAPYDSWSCTEKTMKDGRFDFDLPGPGDYLLELKRDNEMLKREALTVPEDATKVHHDIALPE